MQSSWCYWARNIWTPAITSAHTSGLLYHTLQSPYVKLNIHQLTSHLIIPTHNNEFQALYNFTVLMSWLLLSVRSIRQQLHFTKEKKRGHVLTILQTKSSGPKGWAGWEYKKCLEYCNQQKFAVNIKASCMQNWRSASHHISLYIYETEWERDSEHTTFQTESISLSIYFIQQQLISQKNRDAYGTNGVCAKYPVISSWHA